jgi:hypothetical protein
MKEILTYVMVRVNLKDILLREISQSQKNTQGVAACPVFCLSPTTSPYETHLEITFLLDLDD